MAVRSESKQPRSGADSFAAFFHPETVAAPDVAETTTAARNSSFPPTASSAGGKLDINSAKSSELLNIPGVGPVPAQRIVDARPFCNADELQRVKGIGAKKYERLRPYFE